MDSLRSWLLLSVGFFLIVPALIPQPDPLPEPVYLISLPAQPVAPVPVRVEHPRPEAIQDAYDYLEVDDHFRTGEWDRPDALVVARDAVPDPVVWLPPVFSPKPLAWNVEMWRVLVEEYPWPVEEALAIIGCESSGNPDVISRTNDWGLFQHHFRFWEDRSAQAGYTSFVSPLDPKVNIHVAYWLWNSKGGSWEDWVCADILGL